jgi:hypothetical protein
MAIGVRKTAPLINEADIPEVVDFLDAKDALEAFKESNAALFEELSHLVERYNTALQSADKAVRSREATCGPWNLYSFSTKYDAETLYNALGRDKFLEVGGTIGSKTVYDIDKGRLEAAIAQRRIAQELVESVRKVSPSYHAPKPVVLP